MTVYQEFFHHSPPHERRNFGSFTTSVSSSLDLWVVMVGDMVSVNAQLRDDSPSRQAEDSGPEDLESSSNLGSFAA